MKNFDEENENFMEDKILNNSYNSGEIEFQAFTSPMKVDSKVAPLYQDNLSENMIEQRTEKMLENNLYDIFIESPYYEKYKNPKRVDKGDMAKMYYYFKERLVKDNSYTTTQIFIGFAEFFQINYDQLHEEVGVLDKESLLREMAETKGVSYKIKSKRLF